MTTQTKPTGAIANIVAEMRRQVAETKRQTAPARPPTMREALEQAARDMDTAAKIFESASLREKAAEARAALANDPTPELIKALERAEMFMRSVFIRAYWNEHNSATIESANQVIEANPPEELLNIRTALAKAQGEA